jgi:hypothetical protein
MNKATLTAVQISTVVLTLIYILLFYLALDGYGYSGHNGFSTRASRWYWSNVDEYHERSNRAGSISGTNPLGGGPESGK